MLESQHRNQSSIFDNPTYFIDEQTLQSVWTVAARTFRMFSELKDLRPKQLPTTEAVFNYFMRFKFWCSSVDAKPGQQGHPESRFPIRIGNRDKGNTKHSSTSSDDETVPKRRKLRDDEYLPQEVTPQKKSTPVKSSTPAAPSVVPPPPTPTPTPHATDQVANVHGEDAHVDALLDAYSTLDPLGKDIFVSFFFFKFLH